MTDEITRLQEQLEEAEKDLQQSLSAMNQKVEAVGIRLPAEKAVQEHPIAAAGLAMAAGFALGSEVTRPSLIGALALGVLFGLEFKSGF
jgi:ElaB/YqjD/DUF883 family membrane-anchored ribosome-binding protein